MLSAERKRVTNIARKAGYSEGVMHYTTVYCGEIFRRYMKFGSVLELGPAEGVMTDILFPAFSEDYTIVDGADFFVESAKKRHPGIKGEACLFEDYKPGRKFDNIILGHVLEHVENPVEILKLCSTWLCNNSVRGGGNTCSSSKQL